MAAAGLPASARCVALLLVHARALEASHGLALESVALCELWPPLAAVLARHVRKLGEALRRAAASEVDALGAGGGSGGGAAAGSGAVEGQAPAWEALAAGAWGLMGRGADCGILGWLHLLFLQDEKESQAAAELLFLSFLSVPPPTRRLPASLPASLLPS